MPVKFAKINHLAFLILLFITVFASGTLASQAVSLNVTDFEPSFIPIGNKAPRNITEIKVGIDFNHDNLFNKTLFKDAFALINQTFSTSKIRFISTRLQDATLQDIDVLIIFAPNKTYTKEEMDAIKNFLNDNQKGLLVAGGFLGNKSYTEPQKAINSLSRSFGIEYEYSNPIFTKQNITITNETLDSNNNTVIETIEITVNSTVVPTANFTTPITPVTAGLRQVLLADSVTMKINQTAIDEELVLYQRYDLLMAKGDNQTTEVPVIHAVELESSSRAVFLSSYQLFNDSFIDPFEENTNGTIKTFPIVQDNTKLLNQTIQWLGHYLGYFKFNGTKIFRHTTAKGDLEIYKGDLVSGEVFIFDALTKTPVDDTSVTLFVEKTNIIDYSPMYERSSGLFWFQYNTTGLRSGGTHFNFLGEHLGYFPVVGEMGRVFIRYDELGPAPVNLSMWLVIIITTVIVVYTAFEVYRQTRKATTTSSS